MDGMTRAFVAMVDEAEQPPARWAAWHLTRLGELLQDPVARLELRLKLCDDPELLDELLAAHEAAGEVIADAALSRREEA